MPNRILTSHVGSLPRTQRLADLLISSIDGDGPDPAELESETVSAMQQVLRRQDEVGLDIVSDGEVGRIGFDNYFYDRLSGFEDLGSSSHAARTIKDLDEYPEVAEQIAARGTNAIQFATCVGPIELVDESAIHREIARLKEAIGDRDPSTVFMTQASPGQIAFDQPNKFYRSHEEYMAACARAMRHDYQAIVNAGFVLQLDSPDLAMANHLSVEGSGVPEFRTNLNMSIDALNDAIEGIDPDRIRLHVCWGNYPGPHHHDVALSELVETVFRANVRVISFEAANPRHAHEWEVFEDVRLPDGKVIMPGVIDVTTNRVEHPRLIAQRLERFAGLVGADRVIAAPDCGFSTFVGYSNIHPSLVWRKLAALVEGAQLASGRM
jgi:5-methyltetrahydropteroyltriglutamate--homocysteine methyltransferase